MLIRSKFYERLLYLHLFRRFCLIDNVSFIGAEPNLTVFIADILFVIGRVSAVARFAEGSVYCLK